MNPPLDVSFNVMGTHFAATTATGFGIWKTCGPVTTTPAVEADLGAPPCLVALVGRTNLVYVVKCSDPERLVLWDLVHRSTVAEIIFAEPIRAIRVMQPGVVVLTKSELHVHKVFPPEEVFRRNVCSEQDGSMAAAALGVNNVVLQPVGVPSGMSVFSLHDPQQRQIASLTSHSHRVAAVALSPNEHVVATMSERGTVVHLHDTRVMPAVARELRRSTTAGLTSDLTFNKDGTLLAACGDFGVAVWRVNTATAGGDAAVEGSSATGKSLFGTLTSYLTSEGPCGVYAPKDVDGMGSRCVFGPHAGEGGGESLFIVYPRGRVIRTVRFVSDALSVVHTADW
eukprot:PhM_4_TR10577/c0_g1_i1/m.56789